MKDQDPNDPKGLIREAFRIEGITTGECRSIFVDWALSVPVSEHAPLIEALLERHANDPAAHPMKAVLQEGLSVKPPAKRRGGRAARVNET